MANLNALDGPPLPVGFGTAIPHMAHT